MEECDVVDAATRETSVAVDVLRAGGRIIRRFYETQITGLVRGSPGEAHCIQDGS